MNDRINDQRIRILLYSHDTVGLGHVRRNQAIARGLARSLDDPSILMVSGARHGALFDTPECVELVTIPALKKSSEGRYEAKSRALSTIDATSIRREILLSVVESYHPDVLIVDKVPRGVYGELDLALKWIRTHGRTRCVLGLRDILDDPQRVKHEWARDDSDRVIRQYYDSVWVYGDQGLFDLAHEYQFTPEVSDKMTYVGYLDRSDGDNNRHTTGATAADSIEAISERFALCMVGGGEDGSQLASAFARSRLPDGMSGVVLTGPFMPASVRADLRRLADGNPRLHVIDFLHRPEDLIDRADRVVAMGGYNTVCEIVSRGKTALIVPRVVPRSEQLIRAERMSQLGLLTVLRPSRLNSDAISDWLCRDVDPPLHARDCINLDALSRLPELVNDLVDKSRCRGKYFRHPGGVCAMNGRARHHAAHVETQETTN